MRNWGIATAMNKTMEGIIVSTSDYREHDVILHVLCKEAGLQAFVARGMRKLSSKNAGACQLFTHATFYVDYHENKTMHAMRTADIKEGYRKIREDLTKQAIASMICECIEKAKLPEDLAFPLLKESLDHLQISEQPYALLALFFSCMNQLLGIAPYVDGCVHCQTQKDILGISLCHGGFVCQHCFDSHTDVHYGKEELKCFRLLSKASMDQFPIVASYRAWTYEHFLMVYRFFEEYSGIRIKSIRFLSCLQELEGGTMK